MFNECLLLTKISVSESNGLAHDPPAIVIHIEAPKGVCDRRASTAWCHSN